MTEKQLVPIDSGQQPTDAQAISLGTLQAGTPHALISGASAVAKPLADLIDKQKLFSVISGRKYVRVEGWTTLAIMLGVVPREVSCSEQEGIYTAVVELVRMNDGVTLSRASAECGEEKPWCDRPRYARRSMAITRATGKACRIAFSWIMTLAGYEATPAEEMDLLESRKEELPAARTGKGGAPRKAIDVTFEKAGFDQGAERTTIGQFSPEAKMLAADIGQYGLDRARVIAWCQRTWPQNPIETLADLTRSQANILLQKLPVFAAQARNTGPAAEVKAEAEVASGWVGEPLPGENPVVRWRDAAKRARELAEHADDPTARQKDLDWAAECDAKADELEKA